MRLSLSHVARLAAALAGLGLVMVAAPPAGPADRAAPPHWCGTTTGVDQPDAVSAFMVHVVYAVPADEPDRSAERALPIVTDMAAIVAWWRGQDTLRAPRLDYLGLDCDSLLGRLDLTDLRLPQDGAYYADAREGFARIVADLEQPPLSLDRPEKKYVVFYDGPVQRRGVCGTSPLGPARGSAISVVYLSSACGDDLGRGGQAAVTAAHELLHNLAALPRTHFCVADRAHACDGARDILYFALGADTTLAGVELDSGHDDYYWTKAAPAGWWNVRDSAFLDRLGTARATAGPALREAYATSVGTRVTLTWTPVAARAGTLYRVYRDGRLLTETAGLRTSDTAVAGATIVYAVRAVDADGLLGEPRILRVLVGRGLVDDRGELAADTTPPPMVTGLGADRRGGRVVVRWTPVASGDLAGYRVRRNGRPFAGLVRGSSMSVQARRARATWTVSAVDDAGNVGIPSKPLLIAW